MGSGFQPTHKWRRIVGKSIYKKPDLRRRQLAIQHSCTLTINYGHPLLRTFSVLIKDKERLPYAETLRSELCCLMGKCFLSL